MHEAGNGERPAPARPRFGGRERLTHAGRVIALGCGLSLTAGLAAVLVLLVRRFALQQLTYEDADAAWTVPLGTLLLFGPPVLVAAALAFWFPRFVTLRKVTFVFATAAAYTVIVQLRGIHPAALMLVSIGVGARVAYREFSARSRLLLVAVPLALVGLIAATVRGSLAWREHPAVQSVPPDAAPNVLLLILDTVRNSDLGLYGYGRSTTPRLERLAESSTVFDWAIAPSSWTLPSHVAILTGRRAGEVSARWHRPYDGSFPSLAERLERAGWTTAAFAANYFYMTRESGIARGFAHFEGHKVSVKQAILGTPIMQLGGLQQLLYARSIPTVGSALLHFDWHTRNPLADRKSAREVVESFLQWQGGRGDRPFFAFLNVFDAHKPYLAEAPFDTLFGNDRTDRGDYDRSLAQIDHWLGVLVDSLARRGVLDRTLLIVTSDHGEQFGEHGLQDHGNSLYLPVVRVPLLLRLPGRVPANLRVGSPVSLRDIPATVMDLVRPDRTPGFPGTTLVRVWHAGVSTSPVVSEVEQRENPVDPNEPTTLGPMVALTDSTWHYIRKADGTEELYAFRSDSTERDNRIDDPSLHAQVQSLRARARLVRPTYPARAP